MKKRRIYGLSIAFFIILTSFLISRIPLNAEQLSSFGYFGIFLATFLGTSSIFFPAPNLLVIFVGGRIWNPFFAGLSGGIGCSLGEIGGYLAGRSSTSILENPEKYKRTQRWIKKYRWLAIFLLAAIPNPFFDAVGIVSGFLKLSFLDFFLPVLAGRMLRSLIFAYLGYTSSL